MTRYKQTESDSALIGVGYREGVDRVLEYVEAIHAYPKLVAELKWAIEVGII